MSISRHATYNVPGATVPLLALMVPTAMPASLSTGALQGAERFGIIHLANGTGTSPTILLPWAASLPWALFNMPEFIHNRLAARAQRLPRARSSWRTS